MNDRFHVPVILRRALAVAVLAVPGVQAAPVSWSGAQGADFENPLNWSALPADDPAADTAVFAGGAPTNQPALNVARVIGGLGFSGTGWTLSGGPGVRLTLGSAGVDASGQGAGTNVVACDVVLGAGQTWRVGAGRMLEVTGSVVAGTSPGSPLAGQWVVGDAANAGTIALDPAPGRAVALSTTLASAGAIQINQRLLFGTAAASTASVNTISNAVSAGLRISNSGVLEVRSGEWRTNDLGSNNTGAFSGHLIISGGTLATGGARYLGQFNGATGTTVDITGGTLLVTGGGNTVVNSGYLGLGGHGAATPSGTVGVNVSGGLLEVGRAAGNLPAGVSAAALSLGGTASTSVLFNQTGGTVRVGLRPGSDVFTGVTNANSFTNLSIGSSATSNRAAYTLAGGTLEVAGNVQGVSSAGGVSNFNFLGGTLSVGGFVASALGHSPTASASANQALESLAIGTLVNRGGTLAPGGAGVAGRTMITGDYSASAGSLAVEIGGTTQSSGFQSGGYDFLSVTGTATLGGTLEVRVLPGFTPSAGQVFTVVSAAGGLGGAFTNAPSGARVMTADGLGTFLVSQSATTLALSSYQAVTAPEITSATTPGAAFVGDTIVMGVAASSPVPVTYEWRRDGVLLPDATGPTLILYGAADTDSGTYVVTARNAAGQDTRTFVVAVRTPPSTGMVVVDTGTTRTFAAGAGAATCLWKLDGADAGAGPEFSYTPAVETVGTHWLEAVETYADGSQLRRDWGVRVRIPQPVPAITYYVSPSGSDTGNGSVSAPFRTLEKARDTVRALARPLPAGGVTIYLRGGTHTRTATFALTAADSGSAGAPVVYRGFPGETAIISGGRSLLASNFQPLAASEIPRVHPGVDSSRIWETDLSALGIVHKGPFPDRFSPSAVFNIFAGGSGGLCELFYNGQRMRLSRYPNQNLTDDTLTPNLAMNGVAQGADNAGTGYLNAAGTYTDSNGAATAVGAAFHYAPSDAATIARWKSALTKGGLWLMGYWRVSWQVDGGKVGILDTGSKGVIGFASGVAIPLGIGDKYTRPVGTKKEPYWAVNLLEELDQPGEWCIDFSRNRLYFLMDSAGAPADNSVVLSDLAGPLVQIAASDTTFQSLTFEHGLAQGVQVLGGSRNLIAGCTFRNMTSYPVDLNNTSAGSQNGVVSCSMSNLATGGVLVRGGNGTSSPRTPCRNFVVNNSVKDYAQVVRVYGAAVDAGFQYASSSPTTGVRIAHNFVSGSPHVGMLWKGYDHVFEFNDIGNYCTFSNDMGGIYTYASNYVSGTTIRYNYLHDSPHGEGVYFDSDHVNATVYGNLANLKTLTTEARGTGFYDQTPGTTLVSNTPYTDSYRSNIAVNCNTGFKIFSATGGIITGNVAYRNRSVSFSWNKITVGASAISLSGSNAATLQSGPNGAYSSDPGFLDFANDDLRLRPDAVALDDLPDLEAPPVEMMGIYNDEFRSDARVLRPFVVTEAAAAVGGNTATFTGALAYPRFDRNATVRVYWGTADGGTDPAAWENVADLGQPGAGYVAHTPADLQPGTQYFFRFRATNSAGDHWAEATNSTTTFPLADVSGLTAADAGAALPAVNAADGDPATAWRTAGGPAGTLILQPAPPLSAPVTAYRLVSAADSPAMDPRDWRFEGSADGVTWVTLDTRAGETFSARGQARVFGFAPGATFPHYRLVVTANAGDPSAVQIADIQLLTPSVTPDTTGPVITTPGNITVSGNSSGATVTFDVSAVDVVSGNVIATAVPASGSFFSVGTTPVTVSATDAAGNTSTAVFTVTVSPPALPVPWTIQQIKPYSGVAAGTVEVLSATSFRIVGAGGAATGGTTADLWTGTNDSNTYVAIPWQGDGIFTARLASFSSTDSAAKAGIIFRETTASGSRYSAVYMIRNNSGSVLYQHKTATNGSSSNVNFFNGSVTGKGFPQWIRLVRQGDTFSPFYSADGVTWTALGTSGTNLMSGATLSVGFVVAPRTGATSATAVFDNISFLTPRQVWKQTTLGSTANTGSAADTADPDGDGQSNLIEYALGSLPNSAASTSAVETGIVQGDSSAASFLDITFNRVADPSLSYRVEASTDLSTWTTIWQSTGSSNTPGAVTITDSGFELGSATPPRRFLRLSVSSSQ